MKSIFTLVVASFVLLSASSDSFAKGKAAKRQDHQEKRIENGVESGALTDKEAERLAAQQEKINAYKEAAKADGELSMAEKAKINAMQNRASKAIKRAKNNKRASSAQ